MEAAEVTQAVEVEAVDIMVEEVVEAGEAGVKEVVVAEVVVEDGEYWHSARAESESAGEH